MQRLRSLLSLGLLSILLVGCGQPPATPSAPSPSATASPADDLSVAIVSWVGFAPIIIAQEKGYFADENLTVDVKVIDDMAATKAAVQSGALDLTWGTGDVLLTFADAGIDVQAFYTTDWSNGGDGVVVTDAVQQWSDFEGATVAAQEGLPPTNLLLYALQKNGVDIHQVKFQEMDTAAAALAFTAGKVDIAAVYQPYLAQSLERAGAHAFVTSADYPHTLNDYIAGKPATLVTKKTAIEKFIRACDRAITFIHSGDPEALSITAASFDLTADEVAEIFQDIAFPTLAENKALFTSPDIFRTFTTFQDAMLAAGVLQQRVEVEQLITSAFVE